MKTHCFRRHAYTAENTYWCNGKRYCVACRRRRRGHQKMVRLVPKIVFETRVERDKAIIADRARRLSWGQLGKKYGLTRARCAAICKEAA